MISFIPALRFRWLTKYYDLLLRITFPEKTLKWEVIKKLPVSKNLKLLDFGCGTGTLAFMIENALPDVLVTGVDIDKDVLAIAQKKSKKSGSGVSWTYYNGNELPFNGSTFDFVVSSLVFHHLRTADKIQVLTELYRVLKSGGKLLILDFGKPVGVYAKIAFYIFRRIDGEENTRANARGLVSRFVANTGFHSLEERKLKNTAFGTVTLIEAIK